MLWTGSRAETASRPVRNLQQSPLCRGGKGNISLTCSRKGNTEGRKWEKSPCSPQTQRERQQLCQDKADISSQGHVCLGIGRRTTGQHPSLCQKLNIDQKGVFSPRMGLWQGVRAPGRATTCSLLVGNKFSCPLGKSFHC